MSIQIFTDGSSLGNPGPGGFCAIIKRGAKTFIVKGGADHTTNNRMEMSAIIAGLYYVYKKIKSQREKVVPTLASLGRDTNCLACDRLCRRYDAEASLLRLGLIEVFSDSNLIISTLRHNWKRKKNLDLWAKLDAVAGKFDEIKWHWIRGHAGHKENTKADKIAVLEAKKRLI